MAETVSAGYTAIADAAFLDVVDRDAIATIAATAGVPFFGFWLEAPVRQLRDRIGARTNDASDANMAILEKQIASDVGAMNWHRLSADGTISSIAGVARQVCLHKS